MEGRNQLRLFGANFTCQFLIGGAGVFGKPQTPTLFGWAKGQGRPTTFLMAFMCIWFKGWDMTLIYGLTKRVI